MRILEGDLSDIEISDESISEEPLWGGSVQDYDDEVSRGLSGIFEEPELDICKHFDDPPGPAEELVVEVSTQNEYDSDVFVDTFPGPSHLTPAKSHLAQRNEASTSVVHSPVCVAQNWSDKVWTLSDQFSIAYKSLINT